MAYPLLAELALPPVAKGLFYVGMLATIMSTLNTLDVHLCDDAGERHRVAC